MSQGTLFDAPVVLRVLPGTYSSPTGADGEGPPILVCEGCNQPAMYSPAVGPCACPTPQIHTWKDPGMEPGEGEDDAQGVLSEDPDEDAPAGAR